MTTRSRPPVVKATTVNALVEGSIDMHAHFAPDSKLERSVDIETLLEGAADLKMRGVVLKSKDYPTQPLAYWGKKRFPNIDPIGAVCLDHDVGGLNRDAVKTSGKIGARVVWLPTFSSSSDMVRFGRPPESGISCLDKEGELSPECVDVLEEIKRFDMVLATGHISHDETEAVVAKAVAMGIERIVITHPLTAHKPFKFTIDDLKRYAAMGCYIEHCLYGLLPRGMVITEGELAKAIKEIGPEHSIMSTDVGQIWNPPPARCMKMYIALMLGQGLTPEEVEVMVKTNPARVIGLA